MVIAVPFCQEWDLLFFRPSEVSSDIWVVSMAHVAYCPASGFKLGYPGTIHSSKTELWPLVQASSPGLYRNPVALQQLTGGHLLSALGGLLEGEYPL